MAFSVAGAVYLLAKAKLSARRKVIFTGLAVASIAIKIILAGRGHNYDVDSYEIVSALVLQGKSVYANTVRYNYGPTWGWMLAGLKQLSTLLPPAGQENFHISVATFLATTDVTMAAILASEYSYGAALFFLLSPVTILLTGFHSQFENLALLVGMISWVLIRHGKVTQPRLIISGAILGLSLSIKHILFIFPVWVLFWPELGSVRRRFTYSAIAYSFFAVSFLPWTMDPLSRAGILQNVLRYRSGFRLSLPYLVAKAHLFAPATSFDLTVLPFTWMASLVLIGLVIVHRQGELFPLYLLPMFALSPALADQYLAIPMVACAIFYNCWPSWALVITGTLALLTSINGVLRVPINAGYYSFLLTAQISALVLLAVHERVPNKSSQNYAIVINGALRAAALVIASAAVVLILVWVRT
jgi:hypothetical protein